MLFLIRKFKLVLKAVIMTNRKAIIGGTIYAGYEILTHQALIIIDDYIADIIPVSEVLPTDEIIEAYNLHIAPGLIDLQTYGIGEHLFSADMESLESINQQILASGTTSYLLCLATNTIEVFKEAIAKVKTNQHAVLLGLHLEGPFLNPVKRGAHPEELIIPAEIDLITDLFQADTGQVKMMTIAPERVSDSCLALLHSYGIILSAGHSNATFQEASLAFNKGVRAVTHLFNAMSSMHHREVGLPGATFNHSQVYASIIADGIHVDYEALKLAKKLLGERLFLITDATAACQSGIYQHRLQHDHYVLPDGTLSGSALTMLKAVDHAVQKAQIPLDEALRMATLYPARVLERSDIGEIKIGAKANIILFDAQFKLHRVIFEGL